MKEYETPKHQTTPVQVRNALYISVGMFVVQLVVSVIMFTTAAAPIEFLDPVVLVGVNVITALISIWLNRTGRSVLGIQVILGVQFLSIVLMSLQSGGTGLPIAAFVTMLTFSITSATLPQKMANRANILAGVIAIFVILLDVFEPFDRPGNSQNTIVSWGIAGILVLILGLLILRQFNSSHSALS